MSDKLPEVSVVIPTRPDQIEVEALEACRQLDYPRERLEVLVVRGTHPAIQRNAALRQARGELVYFLDDDSRPLPQNLRRAVEHFTDPHVVVVGGPNICPADAPWLEQVFAVVLGSLLAVGPSRARYRSVGRLRTTTEKELILCNMLARRQAVLERGGFDESLYPNEENALMDELQKKGGRLLYDPQLIVYRRPRRTLRAFLKMLRTYGRGRAEQFRLHPTLGSAPNFVPPLFCLYLAVAPWFGWWALAPLTVYATAVFGQTLVNMPRHGPAKALSAMPLIVLTHLLYGLGFWHGLFTRLSQDSRTHHRDVLIETITF